jgi:UDP-N-acetylglucosamine 3-dehydrogenase
LKRLNVGIIGCGHIAQTVHIPNYLNNPRVTISALCDRDEGLLKSVGSQFRIKQQFTDYKELLKSNTVDAVSVCTPTTSHSRIIVEAASNGVHALCEKPLASTLEEGEAMLEAVSEAKTKFTVGFNYRFLPNHIKTKEYLNDGKIGRLILARSEVLAAGPYSSEFEPSEYKYQTEKRLGVFFDFGSHITDLLIWFAGKPKEIYAKFGTHMRGVCVDDSALVTIKFESGVIGSIITLWLNLPNLQATSDSRKIELVGSKGKIDSDFFGPSLSLYSRQSLASRLKGKIEITPGKFGTKDPSEGLKYSYRREINEFVNSVLDKKPVAVTGEEAKTCLEVILAAYESNKTGSTIKLD